jgi:hypothetical protein
MLLVNVMSLKNIYDIVNAGTVFLAFSTSVVENLTCLGSVFPCVFIDKK